MPTQKVTLIDGLGVRDKDAGVALRATFIVDPFNVIQQVSVNSLNVGRNPKEILTPCWMRYKVMSYALVTALLVATRLTQANRK